MAAPGGSSRIPEILERHQVELLSHWMRQITASGVRRDDLMREGELRQQCDEFLHRVLAAAKQGDLHRIDGPEWEPVRQLLGDLSRTRAVQGFTPRQTATFIFSFKEPLFEQLRKACAGDAAALAEETWAATQMLDGLGLFTMESFIQAREQVIARQQEEMLELSTPVVKLWEGVLALPLIGTLDSARTQVVMESLLQRIVETGSEVAIIDITGVPTVDTLVAQHLIKTVTAARLMGADCIISGIRPQIAQTIVHLGVDLSGIATKASLADAFLLALRRRGQVLRSAQDGRGPREAGAPESVR